VTSEARFLVADTPTGEWTVIRPRENEVHEKQGIGNPSGAQRQPYISSTPAFPVSGLFCRASAWSLRSFVWTRSPH